MAGRPGALSAPTSRRAMMRLTMAARRTYGTGALYEKQGAYYGRWRTTDGRRVNRRLGPVRAVPAEADVRLAVGVARNELELRAAHDARTLRCREAMSAAGYSRCRNVAEGFEGPLDTDRHRGQAAGWKAAGLPWAQG